MAEKAGYKHFMLKEIFEQPGAVRETILGRVSLEPGAGVPRGDEDVGRRPARDRQGDDARLRHLVARGARRQVHDRAARRAAGRGRLRIGVPLPRPDRRTRTLAVVITQSGETADTLAALREARRKGARSIAICNVVGSMATREADGTIYTHAGPEIGVASTKAFTSQLVALYLLALYLAEVRGVALGGRAPRRTSRRCCSCRSSSSRRSRRAPQIEEIAGALPQPRRLPVPRPRHQLPDRARGRAEAEGDLLHPRRGLSGRRDEARPDRAHRRADARRRHRAARPGVREDARQHPGGQGAGRLGHRAHHRGDDTLVAAPRPARPTRRWRCLRRPRADADRVALPLQLLAYHIAVRRGCDVDQPRNLAKSVTVE